MNVCVGWLGKIFGHKYEARYSYGVPTITPERSRGYSSGDIARVINASKEETYQHDICARCGNVIRKTK